MSDIIVDWHTHTDEQGVLWLTLDQQDTDTNVLSSSVLEQLNLLLDQILADILSGEATQAVRRQWNPAHQGDINIRIAADGTGPGPSLLRQTARLIGNARFAGPPGQHHDRTTGRYFKTASRIDIFVIC